MHLAFSAGIHYCLGAALVRLERQIAVATIIEKFPRLKLSRHRLKWRENLMLRGLESLPVSF